MSSLTGLIRLITTAPGDLFYHLATLFAIQLILGIALGHWLRNRRDPAAVRLLVTGLGFTAARGVLMLVALLDRVGRVDPRLLLPPLERFLDLATLLLTTWAFLPILGRHMRLGLVLLLLTLLVAAGTYAVFATLWPRDEARGVVYNGYWQETVWELSTIAVLVLALIADLIWRQDDWGLLVWLLLVWLAGHVLQFLNPLVVSQTAGWVRLANLVALPLLAALTYRRALGATPSAGEETTVEIVSVLDAVRRIETARDIEAALELAALSIARTLTVDMIAVGLPIPGPSKGVRIVALYPPTRAMLAQQGVVLLASTHPLLATVLQTGRLERAYSNRKDEALSALYRSLGFDRAGPLLVLPLVEGNALLGVMLAGNPTSQRRWTVHNEQVLQAVGAAVAAALASAHRRALTGQSEGLRKALGEVQRLAQRVSELETELESQRQRAGELENEAERQRQRAEELDTKLRLQEHAAVAQDKAMSETAIWQAELSRLTETRASLEAALAEWQDRARQLAREKADLQTQLAQAQVAIKELQSRPQPAPVALPASNGSSGIILGDQRGNIVLASQGAQYLLGHSHRTLLGTPLHSLFTEPLWGQAVARLARDGARPGDVATVTLEMDGRAVRAELVRLPDTPGWQGAIMVMFYPEEGAMIQSEMITSLIHELRTPMTSINGYTDLLLGETVGIIGETQRQFLQRVKANIERMGGLLDDLIKVVAVDSQTGALRPEPVNFASVVESVIMALSAQFSERDLKVKVEIPSDLSPIYADRESLAQIVQHLLFNACLCSKPGTEIRLRAQAEEHDKAVEGLPDYLLVSVTDTGGGIAPEDQRRVFQRLYRADNPLIAGLGETGVGLSIAKALVEAHKGRIWVESEMGAGSTFSFILPLTPPEEDGPARDLHRL